MANRLRYSEFAPDGVAAMRALEHYLNTATSLSAVLLEIVRLRASLLNGCSFCETLHRGELRKHNEPESRIEAIAHWQDSGAFTPRERAALAWTDSLTNVQQTHVPDEEFQAVWQFFKDKELADLTLAISSINAWNRLSIAFQPNWNPARHAEHEAARNPESRAGGSSESQSAVGGDSGKVSQD
jgi:AhpD family alkylhydroperoxidase